MRLVNVSVNRIDATHYSTRISVVALSDVEHNVTNNDAKSSRFGKSLGKIRPITRGPHKGQWRFWAKQDSNLPNLIGEFVEELAGKIVRRLYYVRKNMPAISFGPWRENPRGPGFTRKFHVGRMRGVVTNITETYRGGPRAVYMARGNIPGKSGSTIGGGWRAVIEEAVYTYRNAAMAAR